MKLVVAWTVCSLTAGCTGVVLDQNQDVARDSADNDAGGGGDGSADNDAGGGDNGSADNDDGGDDYRPPIEVAECDSLEAIDVWKDITPPQAFADSPHACPFGMQGVALDALRPGVLYVGTCGRGIYKSSDCGASWEHINTGTTLGNCGTQKSCAQVLDTGRQWSLHVDPMDSDILYAANGFGENYSGLFKSTNGGVDWRLIWPVPHSGHLDGVPGFVGWLEIDPDDASHVILSMHEPCSPPRTSLCLLESHDRGETWRAVDGDPGMAGYSPHDTKFHLLDSTTWLQNTQEAMWRTEDSGATWTRLDNTITALGQLVRRPDGGFIIGGTWGFASSPDGIEWTVDPSTIGNYAQGVVQVEDFYYGSSPMVCATSFTPPEGAKVYVKSSDGRNWAVDPAGPVLRQGGSLFYEPVRGLLYSSNCQDGLFRVRMK